MCDVLNVSVSSYYNFVNHGLSTRERENRVLDVHIKSTLFQRKFPAGVIVHSDRGSQYCSHEYRNLLEKNKLVGSMSRKANAWDNAPSESFFHTLKIELIRGQSFDSREEAKKAIFDYIECYYNKKRMHSAIDYMTPYEKECA